MPPTTSRTVLRIFNDTVQSRSNPSIRCANVLRQPLVNASTRGFASTSRAHEEEARPEPPTRPERRRYGATPDHMRAPFSLKKNSPRNSYKVNDDKGVLDRTYRRILGNDGDKLLSDDVKWLAVTHKSFDQGRRGYNDRLAFLGKASNYG